MFLWLHAKPDRHQIGYKLDGMLRDDDFPLNFNTSFFDAKNCTASLNAVRTDLTENLKIMFFIMEMTNQALTYGRHRAKAN